MKIIVAILLSVSLVLCLASCQGNKKTDDKVNKTTVENTEGQIHVEKEIFDVVITMPADMMKDTTQEELDSFVKEGKVHSAKLNEDSSVTYEMSKRQHKKLMAETAKGFDENFNEMVGSEDYPNLTAIEHNDNFTKFKITTKSKELTLEESFSVMVYYMCGGFYGALNGDKDIVVNVDFVNADSGEIISSACSEDMDDTEDTES